MVAAALFGVLTAMVTVNVPLLVRQRVGSKDYGTLFSYVSIGTSLVGSLGISVYGFLFDRFGSYDPGLMLGIGTGVASAALLLVGMAAAKRLMGAAHVRSGAVQAEEPASKSALFSSDDAFDDAWVTRWPASSASEPRAPTRVSRAVPVDVLGRLAQQGHRFSPPPKKTSVAFWRPGASTALNSASTMAAASSSE